MWRFFFSSNERPKRRKTFFKKLSKNNIKLSELTRCARGVASPPGGRPQQVIYLVDLSLLPEETLGVPLGGREHLESLAQTGDIARVPVRHLELSGPVLLLDPDGILHLFGGFDVRGVVRVHEGAQSDSGIPFFKVQFLREGRKKRERV